MSPTTLEDPVVGAIARAHNRTAAAVMINWLFYGMGAVTNPRTRDVAHMADNLGALDFRLDDGEINALMTRPQTFCKVSVREGVLLGARGGREPRRVRSVLSFCSPALRALFVGVRPARE